MLRLGRRARAPRTEPRARRATGHPGETRRLSAGCTAATPPSPPRSKRADSHPTRAARPQDALFPIVSS